MTEFIDQDLRPFLEKNRSSTFEELWERQDPWFEEPNIGRSKTGWSGVCHFTLAGKGFFLKKQENFYTYSIKAPLGRSVARKEFNNLMLCQKLQIPSVKVAYFGVRKAGDKLQTVILAEELQDYMSLVEAVDYWKKCENFKLLRKRRAIDKIAFLVRDCHDKGIAHRSLYPKHIFIHRKFVESGHEEHAPICRLIDFEKAVKTFFRKKRKLRDLNTLNRRSDFWSARDRLYFLQCYLKDHASKQKIGKMIKKIYSVRKK